MALKNTAHPRDMISDETWEAILPTLPKWTQRGSARLFLEAVAFRARTGCPWRDLPERFGHWHKSHFRFSKWTAKGYYATTIVLDILLGFMAAIIVAWFSRHREFRADSGAAKLMGRRKLMINALACLGGMGPGQLPKSIQAFGITSGIGKLFSTHPQIEDRITALLNNAS